MMKKTKIIYWISTLLLSGILLFSAGMYLFQHSNVVEIYKSLGFPAYLIYPSAVAKIGAVIVMLFFSKSNFKEWAYAGLFFDFLLAFFAHIMINDGQQMLAVVAMILLITSYISSKRLANY